MISRCAWCEAEGKLKPEELSSDEVVTHSICRFHTRRLLKSLEPTQDVSPAFLGAH